MIHQHHAHYHIPRLREMGKVYWCHSFGAFAISLTAIFIPIFLIKSGLSINEVLVFCTMQYLFASLLQYPSVRLIQYIRPHQIIAIGTITVALFFYLLSTLPLTITNLILLAFVWAIQHSVYWGTFHYIFGLARGHERTSRKVAGLDAIVITLTTIAPAVGGIIATAFSISYTYSLTIVLLVVAVIPMISRKKGPSKSKIRTSLHQIKQIRRDIFANFCAGTAQAAESVIWPLFIFFIITSYAGIGILSSVIAISSVVVTLFVGARSEVNGEKLYINHGIVTYSITSLGRAAVQNIGHIFGLNLLAGVGRSLFHTPYLSRYYTNSDGPGRLGYIFAMETFHNFGVLAQLSLVLILSSLIDTQTALAIGLSLVAITFVGTRFIR